MLSRLENTSEIEEENRYILKFYYKKRINAIQSVKKIWT